MAVTKKGVSTRSYLSGIKSLKSKQNNHDRDLSDEKVVKRIALKLHGYLHLPVL